MTSVDAEPKLDDESETNRGWGLTNRSIYPSTPKRE